MSLADELSLSTMSMSDLISAIRRRWIVVVAGALLGLGLGFTRYMTSPTSFVSTATIIIQKTYAAATTDRAVLDAQGTAGAGSDYMTTELALLESEQLYQKVEEVLGVKKESLIAAVEKAKQDAPKGEANWFARLDEADADFLRLASITDKSTPEEAIGVLKNVNWVGLFRSHMRLTRQGGKNAQGSVVMLEARAASSTLAVKLAAAYVEAYALLNQDIRSKRLERDVDWLRQRSSEIKHRIEIAEKNVMDFEVEHGLLSRPLLQQRAEIVAYLSTLLDRRSQIRLNQIFGDIGLRAGEEQSEATVLQDPEILYLGSLQAELNALTLSRLKLLERYTPEHPELRAIAKHLEVLTNEFSRTEKSLSDRKERKNQELREALEKLEVEIVEATARGRALAELEQTYRPLVRLVEDERKFYDALTDTSRQKVSTSDTQSVNMTTLQAPTLASVSQLADNFVADLGMGCVLGLVLGAIVAVMIDALSGRIFDVRSFARDAQMPILGQLPQVRAITHTLQVINKKLGFAIPDHAITESMRSLSTQLELIGDAENTSVWAIASAVSGEGKTTIASFLAQIMATSGRRVLLVDADLRRASSSESSDFGLSSVLQGKKSLAEAVEKTQIETFDILLSGRSVGNPTDLLRDGFESMIGVARRIYDVIIIDGAPILPVADGMLVATSCDATLLVVRRAVSRLSEVLESRELLRRANVRCVGIIDNGDEGGGYYYYSRYGYGYPSKGKRHKEKSVKVA